MSATIHHLPVFTPCQADRAQVIRNDVKAGLPGFDPDRVHQAQERALKNWRQGVSLAESIDRAIAWAWCATDNHGGEA